MILIRADANEMIGTGHVMRCLSIARAFATSGQEVVFVTADHRGDKLISSAGFKSICMDSEWTKMEKEPINEIIDIFKPTLILVDSYYVTENYFRCLSYETRIVYIDDINAEKWNVDYLVDYNIFGTVLDYTAYDEKTTLLLGMQYAPLRPEFQNMPPHIVKPVSDVMISAGGSDPEGITEKLMYGVCPWMTAIHFHFVVGALNPRIERIKNMVRDNISLHINEQNMSGLMQKCDVAISAAGTTLYELCAAGIPTITYILADNQIIVAKEFERQGVMISAGDCRGDDKFISRVECYLKALCNDVELRKNLSIKMQTLVDGNGAKRIVEALQ